eukprot:COSAG01_NODE_875_length_12972_cov_61.925503_17_plen_274_part_00
MAPPLPGRFDTRISVGGTQDMLLLAKATAALEAADATTRQAFGSVEAKERAMDGMRARSRAAAAEAAEVAERSARERVERAAQVAARRRAAEAEAVAQVEAAREAAAKRAASVALAHGQCILCSNTGRAAPIDGGVAPHVAATMAALQEEAGHKQRLMEENTSLKLLASTAQSALIRLKTQMAADAAAELAALRLQLESRAEEAERRAEGKVEELRGEVAKSEKLAIELAKERHSSEVKTQEATGQLQIDLRNVQTELTESEVRWNHREQAGR